MGLIGLMLVASIVLLVIFISKVSNISRRLTEIDWELKKLLGRVDEIEQGGAPGKIKKETISPPLPVATQQAPKPALAVPQNVPSPARQISMPKLAPEPKPSRTREEWESLIGGKILNRIGAVALIIGIGYFLKYAFDNNWINEATRVLIGAAVGFLCLGGAYRSHRRGFKVFAQGIVGAGISILYLSVFASFNFYSLVPQWVAFILMSIVTLIALAQGLYYDSIAAALLGWAGGFLTPIMLSTGVANEVGLFSYVVLLDAGLLAITYKKPQWWVLEPLTFAGTWILYLSWYAEFYGPADLGITAVFICIFWLLFYSLSVLQPSPQGSALASRRILGAANAFTLFMSLYVIIDKEYHEWMGLLTIGLGMIYLGTLFFRKSKEDVALSEQMHYVLSSIGFLAIASAIEWKGFVEVMAWSIEAVLLVWIASRLKLRYIWLTGAGLLGFAVLKFVSIPGFLFYYPKEEFSLILNNRAIALLVACASLILSAGLLERVAEGKDNWIATVFRVLWPTALFLFIGLEINDLYRRNMVLSLAHEVEVLSFERLMMLGSAWTAYSVAIAWAGLRFRHVPVFICGLVAALIGGGLVLIRGMAFDPIDTFEFAFNIRAAALLIVAGLFLLHERLAERGESMRDWIPDVRSAMQMALVVLIFGLLTSEVRDAFRKDMSLVMEGPGEEYARLSNLQQLSLSGIWLIYSAALMAAGLWRKLRALRIAAFVLFGITILKIFLYDLSFLDSLYRIFSFIGLGLVLLAVSFAYQRFREVIFGAKEG